MYTFLDKYYIQQDSGIMFAASLVSPPLSVKFNDKNGGGLLRMRKEADGGRGIFSSFFLKKNKRLLHRDALLHVYMPLGGVGNSSKSYLVACEVLA